MAFRFGINLVMYALTGNYKTDQVHAPALLRTAGQMSDDHGSTFAPHIPLVLLWRCDRRRASLITLYALCRAARAAPGRAALAFAVAAVRAGRIRCWCTKRTRRCPMWRRSSSTARRAWASANAPRRPKRRWRRSASSLPAEPDLDVRETDVTTTTTGEDNGTQALRGAERRAGRCAAGARRRRDPDHRRRGA